MKNARQVIPFRRKRTGKTNYRKRLAYVKSEAPRLVVRKSLKNISVQVITYEQKGDRILASANSQELKKLGWKSARSNLPAAYLVGFLAAKKAKAAKISHANLDLGLYQPIKGSKLYAALKGALDAGLEIAHEKEVLPSEDRIKGKHITAHKKSNIEQEFAQILEKIKGTK